MLRLQNNDLQMIVRAHECVMDGFERFAQGHLITLFSATNYCGTANNAGAILARTPSLWMLHKMQSGPCPYDFNQINAAFRKWVAQLVCRHSGRARPSNMTNRASLGKPSMPALRHDLRPALQQGWPANSRVPQRVY